MKFRHQLTDSRHIKSREEATIRPRVVRFMAVMDDDLRAPSCTCRRCAALGLNVRDGAASRAKDLSC